MKEKASYEQLQARIRELEKRAGGLPPALHDLENLVDQLPGAVFRAQISDHGPRRFLLLSQGIKSLCGCPREDFLGPGARSFFDMVMPQDRSQVADSLRQAALQQRSYSVSYRLRQKDGRWLWVKENGRGYRDEQGCHWVEGAILDAHEQWHARTISQVLMGIAKAVNTTHDLDEFYRSIHHALDSHLDLPNFAIAIYNRRDDRIDFPYYVDQMDQQYPVIQGLADSGSLSAEVILTGKPLLINREQIEARTRRLGKAPPGNTCAVWLGVPLIVENQVIGTVLTQSYTDPDRFSEQDKDLLALVSAQVAQAIERKRRDQAIVESEQRYRETFRAIPDPIIIIRVSDGIVLNVNDGFCRLTGYDRSTVVGRAVKDVNFFVSDSERQDLTRLALRQGWVLGHIIQCRHKNGAVLDLMFSIRSLNIDGEVSMVAVARDVTETRAMEQEKKRLEAQFHHAQKMEALGALAGGIAHDFNNLLMGVQGNVSLMAMGDALDRADRERLENIERYVVSGSHLARQLLGFARGENFRIRPVDLKGVIEKSVGLFGRTKKEISVHLDLADSLWTALADEGQIEQVLLNLCVNAAHAMPGGGALHVQACNVTVEPSQGHGLDLDAGRYAAVSVSDTGHGMDEQTRLRIFEPFFTTKTKDRGTGLGLASAYGIIKNHGGAIAVQSRPGHGSTFTFYLPVTDAAGYEIKVAKESTTAGQESILLVDDEPMVLEVAAEMLQSLGYRVVQSRDGVSALDLFSKDPAAFDLVILDMIMPGLGGAGCLYPIKRSSARCANPDLQRIQPR